MTHMTSSDLRQDLATTINRVAFGKERIVLQRNNKDVLALVPMEDLSRLQELEDQDDLRAIEEAKAESGPNVPYDEVRKELGL